MVLRRSPIALIAWLAASPALTQTTPEFARLERVRIVDGGVRIELSKRVDETLYTLLHPSRLVIDLDGTRHPAAGGAWPGKGHLFAAVRSSQYQGGVMPVTRIVLDLKADVVHRSFWNGRHLTVLLERDETLDDLRDALAPAAPGAAAVFRSRPMLHPLGPRGGLVRRFQGTLRDAAGRPLTGNYLIRFSAEDWAEFVYVKAREGRFTARLGTHRALPERYRENPLAVRADAPAGTGWIVAPH